MSPPCGVVFLPTAAARKKRAFSARCRLVQKQQADPASHGLPGHEVVAATGKGEEALALRDAVEDLDPHQTRTRRWVEIRTVSPAWQRVRQLTFLLVGVQQDRTRAPVHDARHGPGGARIGGRGGL